MLTRPQTPPPASKTVPLTIGRYSVLGRAGIGVPDAYRARDPDGVLVAVYLFPSDAVATGRVVDRVAEAARACAGLEHPNVLRVLDFGPEGSSAYLATEWAEATTLARLIEIHGRLPEANVIRFAAQLGQVLDHTRTGGAALCRPLPGNVLVRQDGLTKLIPFGIPAENSPGFAGSPTDYAGVKPVPFAEAVFSLGVLIHEALTGAPWESEPAWADTRRRRRPPRPTGLTERTERAIRRATHPDPAKRPATCAEFLKILRGRPLTAGTPKPDARPASAADNRRGCVRYSLGVGSNCTINTSVFADASAFESHEVWPLVLQDVSASGVGILLARRCEPGTELALEVAGPDRAVQSLPVRVVRVRKENYGHWVHGCAFLSPLGEPELAALLNHICRADGA